MKKTIVEVNPIWEACKEPLRLLVLAIVPFVIVYVGGLNYGWVAVAVLVLRFIDKWLHNVGKATGSETLTKGLTQF